jgi:hypothetical protein
MALRVMALDVLELGRVMESWNVPIQVPDPLVKCWVSAPNVSQVALKVLDINGIKSDDGGVQTDICLGDVLPEVVWSRGRSEMSFNFIQRLEEHDHVLLISFLGGCEAGFVHAVVDTIVVPHVDLVNLLLKVLRKKVHVLELFGQETIEFRIEHADNLRRLVGNDTFGLGVIESRNREAAVVFGVYLKVDVPEVGALWVDGVWSYICSW